MDLMNMCVGLQGVKADKNLRFLLQKVLKQSDVGSLGRIVLPKVRQTTPFMICIISSPPLANINLARCAVHSCLPAAASTWALLFLN